MEKYSGGTLKQYVTLPPLLKCLFVFLFENYLYFCCLVWISSPCLGMVKSYCLFSVVKFLGIILSSHCLTFYVWVPLPGGGKPIVGPAAITTQPHNLHKCWKKLFLALREAIKLLHKKTPITFKFACINIKMLGEHKVVIIFCY